jgi:type IV pilus assembly protein PilW
MKSTFLAILALQHNIHSVLARQIPNIGEKINYSFRGKVAKTPVLGAKSCSQQKGLTLIEILIALLLGVFLLGGVMGIFLNTKQTYRVQDALSRLQENGRFAMDFLAKDIRMADFRECQTITPPHLKDIGGTVNGVVLAVGDNIGLDPNGSADGAPDATSPAKDAPDKINVKWSMEPCGCISTPPTLLPAACPASDKYNWAYEIVAGNLQRGGGLNLVEGVENMQVLYGYDADMTAANPKGDGVANYYVKGNAANLPKGEDWAKVVSVRISLLLQTVEDNIASEQLPYTYNGGTVVAGDRRIRRVFTTTIALRNRIH